MATINLRVGNDALTFQELDDNFTNLNNDKAELSGCTFTGDVNINSATNTEYLMVSRNGSATAEVLQIGVTDTAAVFNYIEDTTSEGTGAYGTYQFKLSGNEGTTPTVNAATLTENLLTVLGTIRITTPSNLTSEATAVMIDSNNDLGYRELGSLAFSSATYDNYSSWTLTADSGSNQTISSGNTMDVAGGTEIATVVSATDTVTVNHSNVTRTDTTSSDAPTYGGTFEAVTSVTSNARGHITAVDVSTVTIPASDERDTNLSWTGGTTAGPTVNSSTGTNAVIPSATGAASGVVTTTTQTFGGDKTFSDNVNVTGTLTATSKSFDIPHPSKEKMRLRYGSLEGPENGVYVRGRMDGEQVIELPDYWLSLVHEDTITVSLTSIGPGSVWVESIENNTITVGGSEKFFYHVFAERKDIEKLTVEYEV